MTQIALLKSLAAHLGALELAHPLRVAIDGIDTAGKTTLADALAPVLQAQGRPVIRASIDGFHHPREVRRQRGADSPEGYYRDSFNYAALKSHLLEPLGHGGDRRYCPAAFDYRADSALLPVWHNAPPDAILLFDGVFLLRPELVSCWDFRIFLHIDFGECLRRAVMRDAAAMGGTEQAQALYERRYMPGQRLYLDACQPQAQADVLIDNTDPDHPVILRGL